MEAFKCDSCGEYYDYRRDPELGRVVADDRGRLFKVAANVRKDDPGEKTDLCSSCFHKILKWALA